MRRLTWGTRVARESAWRYKWKYINCTRATSDQIITWKDLKSPYIRCCKSRLYVQMYSSPPPRVLIKPSLKSFPAGFHSTMPCASTETVIFITFRYFSLRLRNATSFGNYRIVSETCCSYLYETWRHRFFPDFKTLLRSIIIDLFHRCQETFSHYFIWNYF